MKNSTNNIPIVLAFAAIYIIWGSTYMAILIALKDFPPFFLSALRFLLAGSILSAWCLYRKEKRPAPRDLVKSAACGILMLGGGTVSITWAEQHISSGLAAITVTTLPFWFVLLDKRQWKFYFSGKWIITGLITGFIGVVLLLGLKPGTSNVGYAKIQWISILVLVGGCGILWATGSLYQKYHPTRLSPAASVSVQLYAAGLLCLLISRLLQEHPVVPAAVPVRGWLSLLYLVGMGNLLAYMTYIWLLKRKPAAIVGTYAYVSPVIAVLLGWGLAGEHISSGQLLALGIILYGVFFVNIPQYRKLPAITFLKSKKMKTTAISLFICFCSLNSYSQSNRQHREEKKWEHREIFSRTLHDHGFEGKTIKLFLFTIPPGGIDTARHQHNAELIGYVLEGSVVTKMKDKPAQLLQAGDVLYEYPNEVHERIRNNSRTLPAKIVLYYLSDKGASLYKPLHH